MTVIDVASYGASGIGGDDTAAFEAACAAASAGDTIVFGRGRFGISRTIQPPCKVQGLDRTVSTIFALPGTGADTQPLLDFGDRSGAGFSRGALEGEEVYVSGGSTGSIGAIRMGAFNTSVSDFVLEDAAFRNFKTDYWILGSAKSASVLRTRIDRNYFETKPGDGPVYAPGSPNGGYLVALYGSNDGIFADTAIQGNNIKGDGVAIGSFLTNQHRRCGIRSNIITNMGLATAQGQNSYAICVYGADEDHNPVFVDIESNIINGCASAGIYAAQSDKVSVVKNLVNGQSRSDDTTLPRAGIAFNGCDGFLAEANMLDSCWGGVAATGGGAGGAIISNRIYSGAGGNCYGVRADGAFAAVSKLTVLGNDIDLPVGGSRGFRWAPAGGVIATAKANSIRAATKGIADLVNSTTSIGDNPFFAF